MHFQIRRASGGQYYWHIVGSNGKVLATSEMYYSKAEAEAAIESLKSKVPGASIADQT